VLARVRRRFRLLVVGVVLVVVGLGYAYATGIILPREGPLQWSSSTSSGASGLVDPNQPFSFGLLQDVTNRAHESATIDSIEILAATPGLHLVGAYVVPSGAAPGVGFARGYPPPLAPHDRRPVAGTVVDPGKSIDIVLGFIVIKPGRFVFRGVRLVYRVGFTRFRATYPIVMSACAPIAEYVREQVPVPWTRC